MNESVDGKKTGSERLGPDGQPVPAMEDTHNRDDRQHGGAEPGAVQSQGPNGRPAKPGDTPASTTLTADANTGPMIAERPMPASSDRE